MHIAYTLLKHISGLGLIFFVVSLILLATDLENIATVPTQIWLVKLALIAGLFIINRWSITKIAGLKVSRQAE